MKFYSVLNPTGIPIDGSPDSPIIGLPSINGINWVMASGNDGTVVTIFNFPEIQGSNGNFIYYRDDARGGTNEGTPDTGDEFGSFGDMGLWIAGDALVPQQNSLYISFSTFYINEGNKDVEFGNYLLDEIRFPLRTTLHLQYKPTSVPTVENRTPDNFSLENAYPNPFRSEQGTVTIPFSLDHSKGNPVLQIVNVQGQLIKQVIFTPPIDQKTRIYEYHWNGYSDRGFRVPSGIYFYVLHHAGMYLTKKLLLIY